MKHHQPLLGRSGLALALLWAVALLILSGCVAADGDPGGGSYDEPVYVQPAPGGYPSCPPGHRWDGYRCVNVRGGCPPHHHWDGHRCVENRRDCPPGHRWDGGRCVPERPNCPPGHRWDGHRCVDNRPNCPPGHHWDGARCVDNRGGPGCPPGHHWDQGQRRCLPNPR